MTQAIRNEIIGVLEANGGSASGKLVDALEAYLRAILETNQRVNLTRIVDWDEALRLHLLDSIACLPEVNGAPAGDLCDIGTGGGFPGVPLGLSTRRHTVLIDSVAKKCTAVTEVLEAMNLGRSFECRATRAEDIARTAPARFAVVVARAVAPLASLIELAAPLLSEGGIFVALKGAPGDDEVESGRAVARLVGMKPGSIRTLSLGPGGEKRTILTYEKTGRGSVKLPRRTGLAQHQPLA